MILTCPFCTMRYIVSEGAIGPHGRKVRCASCGHEWQQQPEQGLDEALFDEDDSTDVSPVTPPAQEPAEPEISTMEHDLAFLSGGMDALEGNQEETPPPAQEDDFGSILKREMKEDITIPEGVRPMADDLTFPEPKSKKKRTPGKRGGFLAAGLVYLLLLGVFLLLHPQISRTWPASNMVYGWFGLSPALPGQGLALDGLEAKIENGQITMTGNIINLKSEPVKVPAVMAMIVDENNEVLEQVLIVPPADTVDAEGQLAFDVTYPSIPDGALNVNFAFSYVKAKAAAEKEDGAVLTKPEPQSAPEEQEPSVPAEH